MKKIILSLVVLLTTTIGYSQIIVNKEDISNKVSLRFGHSKTHSLQRHVIFKKVKL
jgi:hypothetical protein